MKQQFARLTTALLCVCTVLFSANTYAQNTLNPTGNTSISTTPTASRLTLYNSQFSTGTYPTNTVQQQPGLTILSDIYTQAAVWPINFSAKNPFEVLHTYHFGLNPPAYSTVLFVDFNGNTNVAGGKALSVSNNMFVGPTSASLQSGLNVVGTVKVGNVTTPAGYKLYVEQGILTEKVKVAIKTSADWSDYVFKSDYKLMPLEKVAAFVKANHHLPNVPSAEEVVESGIDMAKMDAKLLEKIEELTLYMIDLKQQNDNLQTQIDNLKK